MSKEVNYQVLASKYLDIIKRTAIDIKADPTKVLELKLGDVVMLDNILLEVDMISHEPDRIYLTTLDSDLCTYCSSKDSYTEYIKHLRNLEGVAVMTRSKMREILESGEYTIS